MTRVINDWKTTTLGLVIIIAAVTVVIVFPNLKVLIDLVILCGGFVIGVWFIGMSDEIILGILNIHKFDKSDDYMVDHDDNFLDE